jgi:hypothetical protein
MRICGGDGGVRGGLEQGGGESRGKGASPHCRGGSKPHGHFNNTAGTALTALTAPAPATAHTHARQHHAPAPAPHASTTRQHHTAPATTPHQHHRHPHHHGAAPPRQTCGRRAARPPGDPGARCCPCAQTPRPGSARTAPRRPCSTRRGSSCAGEGRGRGGWPAAPQCCSPRRRWRGAGAAHLCDMSIIFLTRQSFTTSVSLSATGRNERCAGRAGRAGAASAKRRRSGVAVDTTWLLMAARSGGCRRNRAASRPGAARLGGCARAGDATVFECGAGRGVRWGKGVGRPPLAGTFRHRVLCPRRGSARRGAAAVAGLCGLTRGAARYVYRRAWNSHRHVTARFAEPRTRQRLQPRTSISPGPPPRPKARRPAPPAPPARSPPEGNSRTMEAVRQLFTERAPHAAQNVHKGAPTPAAGPGRAAPRRSGSRHRISR